MNYNEALSQKRTYENSKGVNYNGFLLDEIIIVPSNSRDRERFFRLYMKDGNCENALNAFMNSDLEIWAIDKQFLFENGVLFYKKLL